MGVIRRQGTLSGAAIYAGIFIGFFLSLFVYPKYLEKEELGVVRMFIDLAKLVTPFLLLGIPHTFLKYRPYFAEDAEAMKAFRFLTLAIPSAGTLLSLALYYLCFPLLEQSFAVNSPLFVEFLHLVPVLVIAFGGISLVKAYYRSDFDATTPNIYESVVLRVAYIVAVLVYYYGGLSIEWLVYLFLLSNVLVFASLLVNYLIKGNLSVRRKLSLIDPGLQKEMIYYGLFVIANLVSGSLMVKIDSWMIASLSGLAATGVYYIAMSIGVLIEIPKRALSQITVPVIAKSWRNENYKNVEEIYHKSSLNQLVAGGILFVLVWWNVDDLFLLIPNGQDYVEGKWVVFFIGLSKLFGIATGANIEILQISPHYRYSLWTRIGLVAVAILTNLYFIPIYGITGAAMATALSVFLNNIALFFIILVKLNMQPFRLANLYALGWLAGLFTLGWLIPSWSGIPILDIAIRSSILGTLFMFIVLTMPFSSDIREYVHLALQKIGIRIK